MNTGLDPELLTLSQGYIVPASHFLDAPERDPNGLMNNISYDNAAVEIRPEHSENLETLADNTGQLMHEATVHMRLARRQQKIPQQAVMSLIPAARLQQSERDMESVSKFGCDPSQTVTADYSLKTTVLLSTPENTAYRSAGFHLHQELSHPDTEQPAVAILDGLLGLTDVVMNQRYHWTASSSIRRVTLGYGRAGEHRVRSVPSGRKVLEYRVMSPWPMAERSHVLWTTKTIKDVCECQMDTLLNVLDGYPDRPLITRAINHGGASQKATLELQAACNNAWRLLGGAHA